MPLIETCATELVITYQPASALKINPGNARSHSKGQIRQIAASIKEFSFTNPVLVDSENTIIAGHGRVAAAKLLGLSQVPTLCLSQLSPQQLRAYVIADNRLAEKAGWDDAILQIELQYLITLESELDVTVTGFEMAEIDLLLQSEPQQDAADQILENINAAAVARLGDRWELGKHRLVCGNALEEQSLQLLMRDCRASAVWVDPPFNVKIEGHVCGNGAVHHREFEMAAGEMSASEFTHFLTTSLTLLARYSLDGSVHYVCMDWRHMGEMLAAGNQAYDELLNLCVWGKDNGGMGSFYRSQHELVFVFKKGKDTHRNNVQLGKYGRNRTNLWRYPGVNTFSKQLAFHPTVKPIAMVAGRRRQSAEGATFFHRMPVKR